jgi:hypothetical protein
MANSLKLPDSSSTVEKSTKTNSLSKKDIEGTITKHIGTGKNAKDSFIWMTITWSFKIASGLSILILLFSCVNETEISKVISSMIDIWGVFIPVITLALGYSFGKGG